jgi:transposase
MVKKRKNYPATEKVAIIKRHLVDKIPISDLCDQHGIHPTVFYRWQKDFFENGAAAFEKADLRHQREERKRLEQLEAKLQAKNEVLSELMEEHVRLKKSLGVL